MVENFVLLTKVSNITTPLWAYVSIQVTMWLAVVSQIFLLVPDMLHVVKTRDTRDNKWAKWIVWFICSSAWIAYSVLMLWDNIPLEEIIGLGISEAANLVCLFVIYGIKIYNIWAAKKYGLTESRWCALLHTVYIAKKALPKPIRHKLKKACKNLSKREKVELYIDAFREHNVGTKVRHTIKKTAKKVAKTVIKSAKEKRA